MKFIKVIIDGKEYYSKVDEGTEDAAKATDSGCGNAADEGEIVDAEIGESTEPTGAEKLRRDTEEFFDKMGTGAREFGERFAAGAREFGDKFTAGARELTEKIKSGTERLFSKDKTNDPSSMQAKLLKILPYMSGEEAHNICEKLLADDKTLSELDISTVMPFLSDSDCDAVFMRSIELGREEEDLKAALPYVSEACATKIVDGYIAGNYPNMNIDAFYPFLSDANVKKIFYHIIEENSENDCGGQGENK